MSTPPIRKATGIAISRDNILVIAESLLEPLVMVVTLWGLAVWIESELTANYIILSVILFSLTFPSNTKINNQPWKIIRNTLVSWFFLIGALLLFAASTRNISNFSDQVITTWLWLSPLCQLITIFLLRGFAPFVLKLQGPQKNVIVAGVNPQGIAIANNIKNSKYSNTICMGFFDDRSPERLRIENKDIVQPLILGKTCDILTYIKQHKIDAIYISLPMINQPRILKLLDDLKDTTASIYFLPDIFLTDLIQGGIGQMDGIPVVTICDTPFNGVSGMIKRLFDILFSLLTLLIISPILLFISLGVKISSHGPIIFKQRRYGLDGKQILVYKFRTMTVLEDGAMVSQASKDDDRITSFGKLLRKTSLDELPQFINVIQGRMSVVGPRPHAVSHNETYRKIIKGYMVRHKVRPGITGWAQINGFRGETATLDKMQKRVEFDTDYLRSWSIKLDIYIIIKTIAMLLRKQDNAY